MCVMMLLISCASIYASAANYKQKETVFAKGHLEDTELKSWVSTNFQKTSPVTENEYSIVFVGDTQRVTYGDLFNGTNNLEKIYGWIADNVDDKNIAEVIALGDITEASHCNDPGLSVDGFRQYRTYDAEWKIAKNAIDQLKGKVPYTVIRGNHDDYQIDDFFGGDEDYTSQFGGFYSESSGYYKDSITNSWKTLEIHDDKYLFLTLDYNGTGKALTWAAEVIENHPDHKVIISTHAYSWFDGTRLNHEKEKNEYFQFRGINGDTIWSKLASKYENVIMVASGHIGTDDMVYNFAEGDHGNKVLQILINPQEMDDCKTFTGLVCIMNFSEDGQKIELEYYSPLLDMYKKNNFDTIRLDDKSNSLEGEINMAGFSEQGQQNVYVSDTVATAPKLDGVISENEYSQTRTISQSSAPAGKYEGDLKEYFAYDNDYLYYAYSVKDSGRVEKTLSLLPGNGIYTIDALKEGDYSKKIDLKFKINTDGEVETQYISSPHYSIPLWNEDVFVSGKYDSTSKIQTFEIKISRDYLRMNNMYDKCLAYTLSLGKDSSNKEMWHYQKFTSSIKGALSEQGVSKTFLYLYNYAFFGEVPEMVLMTTAPATTVAPATDAPAVEEPTATDAPKKKGCKGEALSLIAILPVLTMGTTVFVAKKKKNK